MAANDGGGGGGFWPHCGCFLPRTELRSHHFAFADGSSVSAAAAVVVVVHVRVELNAPLFSSFSSAVAACRVRPPLSLSLIHSLRLLVYLCQNQSDGIHQLFSGGSGGGDYHCSSALSSVVDVAVVITSANRTH